MIKFVLEDDIHAEYIAEFDTFDSALKKAEELAALPWDDEQNKCPCSSWKTCERQYDIVEFQVIGDNWGEINRTEVFKISSAGK